ncbi:hypothetical protein FJY71_03250 [candidate division WOR-3 bacterium]|nr:hypothetical protein [candidate division WOR-3 bacterium]
MQRSNTRGHGGTAAVLLILVLLGCAVCAHMACGPKDPLAAVKKLYPDAREYLAWETSSPPRETYLLVRWKPDNLAGVQRAVLLVKQGAEWDVVGESQLGFLTLQEVSNVMARPLDESTVRAFRLR